MGNPQLENNYVAEVSHRNESSEPHIRIPSLSVWRQEEELPEHLVLKASGASGVSTGLGEVETLVLKLIKTTHTHTHTHTHGDTWRKQ